MLALDRSTRINLAGATALVCDSNVVEQDVLGDSIGEFILPGLQKVSTIAPSEPARAMEPATRPHALGLFTDRSEETP